MGIKKNIIIIKSQNSRCVCSALTARVSTGIFLLGTGEPFLVLPRLLCPWVANVLTRTADHPFPGCICVGGAAGSPCAGRGAAAAPGTAPRFPSGPRLLLAGESRDAVNRRRAPGAPSPSAELPPLFFFFFFCVSGGKRRGGDALPRVGGSRETARTPPEKKKKGGGGGEEGRRNIPPPSLPERCRPARRTCPSPPGAKVENARAEGL